MRLKIEKVEDNKYTLIGGDEKIYNFKLTFYGLKNNPSVGDFININDELLNPAYKEYSSHYRFGPLDEPYGRKVTSEKDIDFITLEIGNEKVNLKRFFG